MNYPPTMSLLLNPNTNTLKRKTMDEVPPLAAQHRIRIPDDLQDLSKDALILLVQALAKERSSSNNNNGRQNQANDSNKKTKVVVSSMSAVGTPTTVVPAPAQQSQPRVVAVVPPPSEVLAVRKRMGKNAQKLIKKAVHGGQKKPITELVESGLDERLVREIMKGHPVFSDSKRMTKWKLTDNNNIADLLQTERLVHPVKHDCKGFLMFGAPKSNLYAWARYDSLELKYDKIGNTLSLKIKTFCVETGRPEFNHDALAYSRGEIPVLIPRDY